MKKTLSALLALAFVLAAGCMPAIPVPAETPAATPTASPSAAPTPVPAPLVYTPAPTPEPTPAPTSTPTPKPMLSLEEYPRVDGSTANLPLSALMLSRLTGVSTEDAESLVSHTTTTYAYYNLAWGQADLLLVYEASDGTKESLKAEFDDFEFHPIGRDALVFVTNEKNPVKNLTEKQIHDIYTGKTTSWKELGGDDAPILPFQRDEASGSQAMFIKLVMREIAPMNAPTEWAPGEMDALLRLVASYQNTANALGYSVYYYVKNMYAMPELAVMSVNGIAPTDASIADGSYPYVNEFFAVIRKSEPEGSNVRKALSWLLSPEGAQAVKDAGYVSAR